MADYEIPASAAFDLTLGGERRGVVYERAEVEEMLSSWLDEHGGDVRSLDDCEIIRLPEPTAVGRGTVGQEIPWTAFVREALARREGSGPEMTPPASDGLDATT